MKPEEEGSRRLGHYEKERIITILCSSERNRIARALEGGGLLSVHESDRDRLMRAECWELPEENRRRPLPSPKEPEGSNDAHGPRPEAINRNHELHFRLIDEWRRSVQSFRFRVTSTCAGEILGEVKRSDGGADELVIEKNETPATVALHDGDICVKNIKKRGQCIVEVLSYTNSRGRKIEGNFELTELSRIPLSS